ncbi:MAG: hypothetical protein ABIT01_05185 [Thermoanaerobaculia bacterium]
MSITVARDVTSLVRVPRALFVPWPMGHHFGAPFHAGLQRRVLETALELLESTRESGEIAELRIPWGEVRRQAKALTAQGLGL